MSELLTEREAAERAKVHPRTIRRLIDAGKLPAVNYGLGRKRIYRIDSAALFQVQPVFVAPKETGKRRTRNRPIVEAEVVAWPPPPTRKIAG